MFGNDIVDLELTRTESDWKRRGYLDKIFTNNEKILIQKSKNQEITIWNLWSRKEAVYKIWNRETSIRKFNPIQFECLDIALEFGKVQFKSKMYFTKTEVSSEYIHSIAVTKKTDLNKISTFEKPTKIEKTNGIPYYNNENHEIIPVSKSHHGRFEKIIFKN